MSSARWVAAISAGFFFLVATINLLYMPEPFGLEIWRYVRDRTPLTPLLSHEVLDDSSQQYLLGVGKADITGPVVEINFMGKCDRWKNPPIADLKHESCLRDMLIL